MGRIRRPILHYNPALKNNAKKLRNNSTLSEKLLWNHLKGKKMHGYAFNRQKPIDNYIVDFYCKQLRLAIEIDGDSHIGNKEKDIYRQKKLENLGVRFLRFYDIEVKTNIDYVLNSIEKWLIENTPTPNIK